MTSGLQLTCLCGRVCISITKRPEFIHECNCTLCRKSGARWGYFHPSEAIVEGATRGYCRTDKADPSAEAHFCPGCGCTTHFVLTATAMAKHGNAMMGVNMWLADPRELAGIELRFPDGAAWTGEGAFAYLRDGRIID